MINVFRHTRLILQFLVLTCLYCFPAVSNAKDGRVALVIGNSTYERVSNLPNTYNDSHDLADALERIGFDVTRGLNLSYRDMRIAIRDFAEAAAKAKVVVIYFAGHGIEIDNTNYLIPVDAALQSDRNIDLEAIRLDTLIGSVSGSDGLKIILIDACRNNPFVPDMKRTSATRSIGRGLARIDPSGVLVGYAARSGTLALDGSGRNSPYAQALLRHIEEPGLELGKMFRKVRDTVFDLTDGYQEPFTYGSLPGHDIFLVPPLRVVAPAPEATDPSTDATRALANPEIQDLCRSPQDPAHILICVTPELLLQQQRVQSLFDKRLEELGGGDAWGQLLLTHLEHEKSRDACGEDVECLSRNYREWFISLTGSLQGLSEDEQVVYSIQVELNRLSCGAGQPDGKLGNKTRGAMSELVKQFHSMKPLSTTFSIDTLSALRELPSFACSGIVRGAEDPKILNGTWRLVEHCPEESPYPNMVIVHSLKLRNTSEVNFFARLVRTGGWIRELSGGIVGYELRLTTPDFHGIYYYYYLKPTIEPFEFHATSRDKCHVVVSRG
ncbi:caspase family protein [uncultured Ruegeria sp.]|uniref:caspase family protein n=1 Tax=uncultured Ruegeria sp. TaxID=259304 RepID=UPI00260401AE|nr:caspase family protein [uncultured Ruegeria sp.]